jgi:hypothetical protein
MQMSRQKKALLQRGNAPSAQCAWRSGAEIAEIIMAEARQADGVSACARQLPLS